MTYAEITENIKEFDRNSNNKFVICDCDMVTHTVKEDNINAIQQTSIWFIR